MATANRTEVMFKAAVGVLGISALVIALLFHDFRAEIWVPSLVCNLLTTATAIYVINILIAGAERRRLEADEKLKTARRELRRARRARARRELVGSQTLYPAALCLSVCNEILLVAEHGTVADVLELVRRKEKEYSRQAEWVRHLTLLYGRFLTFKELNHLDNIQRSISAIILQAHAQAEFTEETHKVGVISTLEQVRASNLTLGMSFSFHQLMDMTSEANKRIGALRRKWDIPAIRKKMRESMAEMVEAVDPEIARLVRKQPEPDDDDSGADERKTPHP